MEGMERREEETQRASNTLSTVNFSPPLPYRERKSYSPPVPSPVGSTVSSDHISHRLSSLKEATDPIQPPENSPSTSQPEPPLAVTVVNRSVRDEPTVVTKVGPVSVQVPTGRVVEEGVSGGGRKSRPTLSILRRTRREKMVKRVALGCRICGSVLCLISFAVMAANKKQGWALDSFDRYKELRYCLSVNAIGFAYSAAQALNVAYNLTSGKHIFQNHVRYHFDFFMDQVLSYLLISASSSAATRIDDWQSNWGKDKFPTMATASIGVSFVAFVALASSAIISGYTLHAHN